MFAVFRHGKAEHEVEREDEEIGLEGVQHPLGILDRRRGGAQHVEQADVIARASQVGTSVVVDLGSGNTVTLSNYSVTQLNTADIFIF